MQIDSELLLVESSLSSNISSLKSAQSTLSSYFDSISSIFSGELSSINSYFNGGTASGSLQGEISTLNGKVQTISSQVKESLSDIITRAEALVSNIGKLKTKLSAAQAASNLYSRYCSYTAEQLAERGINLGYYRSDRDAKVKDFNDYQDTLKGELASLKAADIALASLSSSDSTSLQDISVIGSTFERLQFQCNGLTYDYYIYVPQIEGAEKLPMVTYLHGNTQSNTEWEINHIPLIKDIKEGKNFPGIVLIPLSGYANFSSGGPIKMTTELTNKIIDEYNVDTERMGIVGYSGGGVGAFVTITNNPNRYSTAAIISGATTFENCEKIANTDIKLRLVTGDQDTNNKSKNKMYYDHFKKVNPEMDIELEWVKGIDGAHNYLDEWSLSKTDLIKDMFYDMYGIAPLNNNTPSE